MYVCVWTTSSLVLLSAPSYLHLFRLKRVHTLKITSKVASDSLFMPTIAFCTFLLGFCAPCREMWLPRIPQPRDTKHLYSMCAYTNVYLYLYIYIYMYCISLRRWATCSSQSYVPYLSCPTCSLPTQTKPIQSNPFPTSVGLVCSSRIFPAYLLFSFVFSRLFVCQWRQKCRFRLFLGCQCKCKLKEKTLPEIRILITYIEQNLRWILISFY